MNDLQANYEALEAQFLELTNKVDELLSQAKQIRAEAEMKAESLEAQAESYAMTMQHIKPWVDLARQAIEANIAASKAMKSAVTPEDASGAIEYLESRYDEFKTLKPDDFQSAKELCGIEQEEIPILEAG